MASTQEKIACFGSRLERVSVSGAVSVSHTGALTTGKGFWAILWHCYSGDIGFRVYCAFWVLRELGGLAVKVSEA